LGEVGAAECKHGGFMGQYGSLGEVRM